MGDISSDGVLQASLSDPYGETKIISYKEIGVKLG
jgi:hypothetical protein